MSQMKYFPPWASFLIVTCLLAGAVFLKARVSAVDVDSVMKELSQQERCFALNADHIALMRELPVYWDPLMESGAVVLGLHQSPNVLKRVLALFRSEKYKRDLEGAFQIFLNFGSINPGTFPLGLDDVSDYLADIKDELRIKKRQQFELTEAHIKLLNSARGEWSDFYGSLGINPKRPFGDSTFFELDMADILGIELAKGERGNPIIETHQQETFDSLFQDLPFSMSVFLKHASLPTGVFCRKPAAWGAWERRSYNPSGLPSP